MKLDPRKAICGVKPGRLKALLQQNTFDTPEAMKVLQLDEPEITTTLVQLQNEGWIEFVETHKNIDAWSITQKGRRLTATHLHKRIAPEEGRKIIDEVIKEVRLINTEPGYSMRITRVILFGSLLPSRRPKTVGDVDLVVQLGTRQPPLNERDTAAILEEEVNARPNAMHFMQLLFWPQNRILLRLKRVSRYVSLHGEEDIDATGAPHQEIYAFDIEKEMEVAPNSAVRRRKCKDNAKPLSTEDEPKAVKSPHPLRPWPELKQGASLVGFPQDYGYLAQHLWQNGVALPEIAEIIPIPSDYIEAYLASQNSRHPAPGKIATVASLRQTVLALLPADRQYSVDVAVALQGRSPARIRIEFYQIIEGKKKVLGYNSKGATCKTEAAIAPTLNQVVAAVYAWLKKNRKHFKGATLEHSVTCHAKDTPAAHCSKQFPDMQPFLSSMEELLQQLHTAPYCSFDFADLRFETHPNPSFFFARSEPPSSFSRHHKKLKSSQAKSLFGEFEKITASHPEVFTETGSVWKLELTAINSAA